MIPLTEKEESLLDKGFLQTTRNDQEFNIYNNKERVDILCYGEIDLSDGSDDYNVIDGMNFLSHLSSVGLAIPSNYDYNEHCCYSINKKPMYYDTTSPALLAQYYHARLGKPKRCCIFKEKIYDTRRAVV